MSTKKKEPRPGTKVPDSMKPIPSDRYLKASPRKVSLPRSRGDNSPGYTPGYSGPATRTSQGGMGGSRQYKDPGYQASRYIYQLGQKVSAGMSGRQTQTPSGWKEVPLDYVPRQGELVVQGPKGGKPDLSNPAYRKVPTGGYQPSPLPKSPSGAGYTGHSKPQSRGPNDPQAMNTPQGPMYGESRGPNDPQAMDTPQGPVVPGQGDGSIPASILDQLNQIAQGTGLEIDYTPGTAPQIHTPAFPKAPSFDFKRNDFSDEANAAMAKAYGPRYAAIDAAKQSVVEAQTRSDEIVKGIYQQLYSDLNSGAAGTKADYDNAATAATTAGTDSAAAIRANAKGSNADLIAEMKANGLSGEEIAQAVGTTQTDTNAAANQAINAGQANNQYMAAQGKSATDFANTMAGAAQNQGAVSREQIAADAAQAIQGYSNQALDISGQQAAQAIDYGQDLSQQDMNIQQMQYGVLSDQYQGNVAGWTAGANNAFQNAGLAMQQAGLNQNAQQFQAQQAADMSKARIAAAQQIISDYQQGLTSAAELAEKTRQFDLTYGLDRDKAANDLTLGQGQLDVDEANANTAAAKAAADAAAAGAEGAGGIGFDDAAPETQFMARVADLVPGKDPAVAKQYIDFITNAVNNNGNLMADTPFGFETQIQARAVQAGLDPYTARQVASAFYEANKASNPANAVQ